MRQCEKREQQFHSSHQAVELRNRIQRGSIIIGLDGVFEIHIEGENQ
jgi:hypothetical protein